MWETWQDAVKTSSSTASQNSPHSWRAELMSGGTAKDLTWDSPRLTWQAPVL
jgi:hypothetical protein